MASNDDCSICYQKMVLPMTLSCNHSFCFLCIKGVCETTDPALCPMCRDEINTDLFKSPKQKGRIDMRDPEDPITPRRVYVAGGNAVATPATPTTSAVKQEVDEDDKSKVKKEPVDTPVDKPKVFWLYQGGKDKWWRFDPRLEKDMEDRRVAGMKEFDMMICGHSYRMNMDTMVQQRLDKLGGQPMHGRKRELLRVEGLTELRALDVKGIAGVRLSK